MVRALGFTLSVMESYWGGGVKQMRCDRVCVFKILTTTV